MKLFGRFKKKCRLRRRAKEQYLCGSAAVAYENCAETRGGVLIRWLKYSESLIYFFWFSLDIIENIEDNSTYIEYATLLKGEIFDYLIQDKSKAVDVYLLFLDLFPDSIYYDLIRLRLRKLADDDV